MVFDTHYVILNLFNTVQFAHTRHSSSKLGFALFQSQISESVRGEKLVKGAEKIPIKARSEFLNQVQDDIWRYLLLILSFWGSQFNTSVKKHNPYAIKILYKTVFL